MTWLSAPAAREGAAQADAELGIATAAVTGSDSGIVEPCDFVSVL